MSNNENVRRLESDPQAVNTMGRQMIAATRAGKVSGKWSLFAESLRKYAKAAEDLGLTHLAADLRFEASRPRA